MQERGNRSGLSDSSPRGCGRSRGVVDAQLFLTGPQTQTSFVCHSKRGTPLRETKCAAYILASCVENPWVSSSWGACVSSRLQSQVGIVRDESCRAPPTNGSQLCRDDGKIHREIPLDKVQEAFSKMELENMEVIGKRSRCTGSRLVVYNQQTRGMSGRRTMAV